MLKAMGDISEVWGVLGEGAEAAIRKLTARFYEGVAGDALLRPMYPDGDLGPARERLALFLIQRLGGPATYSEQRGHPRLRMRHAEFHIGPAARDAWLRLMFEAMASTPELAPVEEELRAFFTDVAVFLQNRPRD